MVTPLVSIEDFERVAGETLDRNAWNYYSSGAIGKHSLRDNLQAYSRLIY